MKLSKITIIALSFLFIGNPVFSQTVDDVINKYIKQIGGVEKWKAVKTMKTTAKVKVQGMDLPLTITQKAPNMMKGSVVFQGKEMVQPGFDGKTAWSTNFMTMKPEKSDDETSKNSIDESQMLDPFIDYAARGYKASLEGSETVEGTDCHKVKLVRKPIFVDGKEEINESFYFFDKENNVPILVRQTSKKGQAKGSVVETVLSDYQEVNGLFLPFSMTIKYNGQVGQSIVTEKVEFNVDVDDKIFAFPVEK